MKAIEAEIMRRSSTVLARVSIFVARVPSLARKRAIILLRDFCDTEDYLDKKFQIFQIYKFTLFSNESSVAAIFSLLLFVLKVTAYEPF